MSVFAGATEDLVRTRRMCQHGILDGSRELEELRG